jgi:hypothetical protein
MAQFVTNEVIQEVKNMLNELLDDEQEGIDDLFGDQGEDKNRRVTLNMRVNLSAKSATAIEIKTNCDYTLEPSIPAKKQKKSLKKIVDTKQGVIEFPKNEEEEEEDTEE